MSKSDVAEANGRAGGSSDTARQAFVPSSHAFEASLTDTTRLDGELMPLDLSVAHEHIADLTATKKPVVAVEELIWNALDADACNVTITLARNNLDGLEHIVVEDDGHGINPATKEETLGKLGGSLKRIGYKTPGGRTLHGKEGKGRFRAFALGDRVEWASRYNDNGVVKEWSITGDIVNLCRFKCTKPRPVDKSKVGTVVTVTNVTVSPTALNSEKAQKELLMRLALYLRNYPDVRVTMDGKLLDVTAVEDSSVEYDLHAVDDEGTAMHANLRIIEWNMSVDRRIFLCNTDGFARHEEIVNIQAPDFNFTAYVMSPNIAEMTNSELLMGELDPRILALTDAARDRLREHFKARDKERLRAVVDQWKVDGIYPYHGEAASPVDQVERQVFDILAIKVHERLPGFKKNTLEGKLFTFKLLRQAIESSPSGLQTILHEVLKLPRQQQDEFADLLQKTKLSGIIKASKVVSDRLAFLAGLKNLLFEPHYKKHLRERSQLHRILVNELWVFGEQYELGTDDQGLRKLLNTHAKILGREMVDQEVKDINGEDAIPDLMLYRRFADRRRGEYEHLVIELKRPKLLAGGDEISQIRSYAHTIIGDQRFDKEKTRWTFVLVVNGLNKIGESECQPQSGRKYGHIGAYDNLDIYVMKWSSVIQDCEWRHEFYRKELDLEVQEEDARHHVNKKYAEYLPKDDGIGVDLPAPGPASASVPSRVKKSRKPSKS